MRLSIKAATCSAAVSASLLFTGASAQAKDANYERANPNWQPEYPYAEEKAQNPGAGWGRNGAPWRDFMRDWTPEKWGVAGGFANGAEQLWAMFNTPGGWDNQAFLDYLLSIGEDWWVGTGFTPGPNYAVSGMAGYDWLHPGGALKSKVNGEWVEGANAIPGPPLEHLGATGSSYDGWDAKHFGRFGPGGDGDNDRKKRRRDRDRDRDFSGGGSTLGGSDADGGGLSVAP